MAWITFSRRRPFRTLACALGIALFGCSGSSGGPVAPDQDPPTQDPAPHDPPTPIPPIPNPPVPNPPPEVPPGQDQGIVGTYALAMINNSQPGQLVTISNPDGKVIGLYRFDVESQLQVDALQTFALELLYTDDKTESSLPDEGEFKWTARDGVLSLTFTSDLYSDSFTGIAANGVISIQYDFDGDGQLDTVFGFQRVGG